MPWCIVVNHIPLLTCYRLISALARTIILRKWYKAECGIWAGKQTQGTNHNAAWRHLYSHHVGIPLRIQTFVRPHAWRCREFTRKRATWITQYFKKALQIMSAIFCLICFWTVSTPKFHCSLDRQVDQSLLYRREFRLPVFAERNMSVSFKHCNCVREVFTM